MSITDKWIEFTEWLDNVVKGPVVEATWLHHESDTAMMIAIRNGLGSDYPIKLIAGEKVELTGSPIAPDETLDIVPGTVFMASIRAGSIFAKPSMDTVTLRFG